MLCFLLTMMNTQRSWQLARPVALRFECTMGALDKIGFIDLSGNPGNSAAVDNALREREVKVE